MRHVAFCGPLVAVFGAAGCVEKAVSPAAMKAVPSAVVREVEPMGVPGVVRQEDADHLSEGDVDCNSPAHWDHGRLYVFFSAGHPWRSEGPDIFHLSRPSVRVAIDNHQAWRSNAQGCRWIEATHKAADGKLYAWYHNEPDCICCRQGITAPRIGQMVSTDNGLNWTDQGLILEAPPDSCDCASVNTYFAGGNGDFCVIPDRQGRYLYFLMGTYHRDIEEQGVSIARMRVADLADPRGKVFKWHRQAWSEPGLRGRVTPILRASASWHCENPDVFWGPSVHWNTHLKCYVMLLNRAIDKSWAQEGIYISYNPDIADPQGWTPPVKILDSEPLPRSKWYPQVFGLDAAARETDRLAGRRARLFVAGESRWEIEFLRPGETPPAR